MQYILFEVVNSITKDRIFIAIDAKDRFKLSENSPSGFAICKGTKEYCINWCESKVMSQFNYN